MRSFPFQADCSRGCTTASFLLLYHDPRYGAVLARVALSLFVVIVLVCCDPFCALQAYIEGVRASSNFNIIALDLKKKLKNNSFVGNSGHFDNEFDFARTEGFEGTEVDHIKPQKFVLVSSVGHRSS